MKRQTSRLPDTRRAPQSAERPRNEYYETVSSRLGVFQVVLYLSLLAFVVLSFFRNTQLITYRNFYYFVKDLNASAETVNLFETDSVGYPTSEQQSFTLYRKGLAAAGNDSVTIFTATGRQTVSLTLDQYRNPAAVGSGRYLLVYEVGGTRYSLYNSYSRISSGTTEYPITCAAVSDSGMYAIASSSAEYTSVVSLYNNRFALINRYNKTGYVMSLDLNEKGTALAILTSSPEDGALLTELSVYPPRADAASFVTPLGSDIGVSCSFSSAGTVNVLCSGEMYCVSSGGSVTARYHFGGRSLLCAENGENGLSVCLKSLDLSEKNSLIIFDKNGKLLYNEEVPDSASQIARYGDTVFLLCADGVARIRTGDKTGAGFLSCQTEKRKLLAVGDDEILLCSPQKAVYLSY